MNESSDELRMIDHSSLYLEVNVDSVIDVDPAYLRATENETRRTLVGDNNEALVFSPWCERLFAVSIRYPDEAINTSSLTPFVRCLLNVPPRSDFRNSLGKDHEMLIGDTIIIPGSVSCVLRMQIQAEYRGAESKYLVIQVWELTESGPRPFGESFISLTDAYLAFARTHPSLAPRSAVKKLGLGAANQLDKLDGVLLPQGSALHYFPVWPLYQKEMLAFENLREATIAGRNIAREGGETVNSIGRLSTAVKVKDRRDSEALGRLS